MTAENTTGCKIEWTKEGDWDRSNYISYIASVGGFKIIRSRICGEWTAPTLYRNDRYLKSGRTVAEMKKFAGTLLAEWNR